MNADNLSPKTENLRAKIVFALVILHLAVALPLAYVLNIWMDEASTLYTTQNGFSQTFQNVFTDERQAPLYFLIVSIWRTLGDSIFFARLFSVLCAAAAIKFFYDLARRFLDEREVAFVSLFFAIHPYLIWGSVEIRVYSLVILLSILLLKFFEAGYLNFQNADAQTLKRGQIFYVVTAIVALYTNYYLGFLLVGAFLALIVLRGFGAARNYFLQMLAVGAIALLPLFWIVRRQFAVNSGGFVEEKSLDEGAKILFSQILYFVFPVEFSPGDAPSAISVIRICFIFLAIAWVIFLLVKNKFRIAAGSEKILAAGTIAATVAAFLLAAYFLLGAEFFAPRHFAVLFVPIVLFAGALFANVLPRRSWLFFAVLFALLFPYSKIYKQYPSFAKRGDWARVAQFIEQNEKPNQPIVIFQNYDALSLPFYYRGVNRILPDEKFFVWNFEDSVKTENAFQRQIQYYISKIPTDAPEIWLATEAVCQDEKTKAACRPLENFVEANYTVEDTRDFYSERVRLLRKK